MLYFLPSEGESRVLLVMGIGEPCLCSGAPQCEEFCWCWIL